MALVERIAHDAIEGIRVGRFPFRINTTCIIYRLGTTLIDTGPSNQWPQVERFIRERNIEQIILTHHHEDHCGNVAAIAQIGDAAVLSPPQGIPSISKGFPLHLYQRVVWGKPNPASALPVPQTIPVDDDCKLQTIHTPGHSLDMTSYLEPNRGWLFTGDLYVSKATRYLREDEDLDQQIKSLAFVLRLDFDTVFCAHRGVVESGKQALKDKLDSLLDLSGRAQDLHRQGKSPREITRILLGREDLMTWLTWYHYSKLNVIQWCLKVRPAG